MTYYYLNINRLLQIYFNSLYTAFDWLIGYFTESKYSHAAIIIKDPKFSNLKKGLYVLESSCEPFKDVEDGKIKFGVELVELKKVLDKHDGNVFYRKLECKRDDEFYAILDKSHSTVHNCPYDVLPQDWFKAALGEGYKKDKEIKTDPNVECKIKIGNKSTQRVKTFWCSALVAYIYTKWGFLKEDTPWTLISPEQFGTEHNDGLVFQNCKLEKEALLKK